MPAYALAHLRTPQINDEVLEYIERIQATLDPYGGRFLVHGAEVDVQVEPRPRLALEPEAAGLDRLVGGEDGNAEAALDQGAPVRRQGVAAPFPAPCRICGEVVKQPFNRR